jgi:two-component system copper resistance phosphate regulon response regulator CusR
MVRILIVDDDPKFRRVLREGLANCGIESEEAPDGAAALELLERSAKANFDLMLLDVMMPKASGWEVLERLRSRQDNLPTIFVTARDAVEERVKGLELGADDYIIKPFEFSELLARIEAVIRRRGNIPVITRGPLTIDLLERAVTINGTSHELSTKEFDLLLALARARGEVVARSELLKEVWGIEFDPETNLVDVFVARLRRRLRPDGSRLIQTVRGQGYCLVEPSDD